MDKRKRRVAILQNLLITLLTMSAAFLFVQTQWYNLDLTDSYLNPLSSSASSVATQDSFTLRAPVRVAVTGAYGRYGSITLTTAEEAFEPLGSLLKDALGSASSFSPSTYESFVRSLDDTSVYYDFLTPLPLSVIAGLFGADTADDTLTVRRLVISYQGENGGFLHLWDGGQRYLQASLPLSFQELSGAVNSYDLGTAFFAGDSLESEPLYALVDPLSLFLYELPDLPVLSASAVQADPDSTLSALGFNPHTNNRYPSSDGSEVISEGSRSLRIYANGTVIYRSGGSTALTLDFEEDASAEEIAIQASALLSSLTSGLTADAALYLQEVTASGSSTTLRFGYQCGGIPIYFSDGRCAAEVTLSGSAVSSVTLQLRSYAISEEHSTLLPLRQALAIAAQQEGSELAIGYADGGSSVKASWLLA